MNTILVTSSQETEHKTHPLKYFLSVLYILLAIYLGGSMLYLGLYFAFYIQIAGNLTLYIAIKKIRFKSFMSVVFIISLGFQIILSLAVSDGIRARMQLSAYQKQALDTLSISNGIRKNEK